MTKAKHTVMPMKITKEAVRITQSISSAQELVNSHEELLDACKRVHRLLEEGETVSNMQDILEDAIAKAEGQK